MLKLLWIIAMKFALIVSAKNITVLKKHNINKRDYSVTLPNIDDKIPWLTKDGAINDDLLNVQALIVKDEDVANDCRFKQNVLYS